VLALGLITLPLLFIAIIILITNANVKPSKYKLILNLSITMFFAHYLILFVGEKQKEYLSMFISK
jgi:hypothetical protein